MWWGAFPDYLQLIAKHRENSKFLPGVRIPKSIRITPDIAQAVAAAALVVFAVPSQHLRAVARQLAETDLSAKIIVSVAKGIEQGTLKRMSDVITDELGNVALVVLSGPNIATEIARGYPASSVVAATEEKLASDVQRALANERFRLYISTDVIGVELGGALKNPIAIAAGVSDGLGFGANAKAALITRGVVEMARLGIALGAEQTTFWGLSGLGDLVTTCLSGRNHWLGAQLGQGRALQQVLSSTPMVIEGIETARAAAALARKKRIQLPIIEQVHAILFQHRSPQQALRALMKREQTSE